MSEREAEIARLRQALHSSNRHECAEAAVMLGRMGVQDVAPELAALHKNPDDLIAIAAMYGSWELGVRDVPIERAVAALAAPDEEIVQESVHALCEMGEAIVPTLIALLEARSPHSANLLRILGDIGGEASLAAVQATAASSDSKLRKIAWEVLADWG